MNQATPWLETADRIGCQLCRDALWSDGRCSWLGWSMEPLGGAWVPAYRSFGADLYNGTTGIALFLARLHAFTQDRLVKTTMEGALNQALSVCGEIDPLQKAGLHSGLTGIAYALCEIGRLLGHDGLVQRGLAEMAGLLEAPLSERTIDVISGGAGGIPVWIECSGLRGGERLTDLAVRHGEYLLTLAQKSDEGWSWDTMQVPGQKNLVGYSHGTAGIAVAMLELYRVTRRKAFLEAAQGALRYERRHFSPTHGNWPDFRQLNPGVSPDSPTYTIAWCHGAAGIGLARLRTAQLLPEDGEVAGEIETALRTTQSYLGQPASGGMNNYSLCHGISGNAELLLIAAEQLGRPELRQFVEAVARQGIEQFHKPGVPWPCGLMQAGETPGLMLGLAGIGYFYLRLHDSTTTPPVLIVRPGTAKADSGQSPGG